MVDRRATREVRIREASFIGTDREVPRSFDGALGSLGKAALVDWESVSGHGGCPERKCRRKIPVPPHRFACRIKAPAAWDGRRYKSPHDERKADGIHKPRPKGFERSGKRSGRSASGAKIGRDGGDTSSRALGGRRGNLNQCFWGRTINIWAQVVARDAGSGLNGKDMLCWKRKAALQPVVNDRLPLANEATKGGLRTCKADCPC